MPNDYYHRVHAQTPTRLWVNNPDRQDTQKALAAGAINVTTNPTFCDKLLQADPQFIYPIIKDVVETTDDDDRAAEIVFDRCVKWVMEQFMPLYERSGGKMGFVTIQDDPRRDDDPQAIINAALRQAKLSKNFIAKIPVTEAGIKSIEYLISQNIPICATEVFSISQAVHVCELYERVSARTGRYPVFFVTHITGIYDQYLQKAAQKESVDIEPAILSQAGCIVARKEHKLIKDRGYKSTLLGGGARGPQHFTEFVGGDMHITLNWSTIVEIAERNLPVECRIDTPAAPETIEELRRKLPDFRRAYDDDGLPVAEYAAFGPVRLFRGMFLDGYNHLVAAIASSRQSADMG